MATVSPPPVSARPPSGDGAGEPPASTAKRRFLSDAAAHVRDLGHRLFVRKALGGYYINRDAHKARYRDWEHARDAASLAKWSAVNRLHELLPQFVANFEAGGGQVHWARDAAEAREIILQLVREAGAKAIVKSKCMTSEEIHLNAALEAEGFGVVESDLGEFIQQLRGEPPYHFVFPCMHVRREEISELFKAHLGSEPTDSPEELTMIARRYMRQLYVDADVGITGANFLVAETGQVSITENEGNARLTAALPRVHIAISGIEKVVANLDDLAVLLPMLATAGAGQPMTCYNTLYAGPRRTGEADGPEAMHLVLLDNSRTALLADPEQRDALHCIRCGACLNVCPIFKNVGGFTYGTTYQGPIGSVITPHLRGLHRCLPRADRHPPPSAAQPPQRRPHLPQPAGAARPQTVCAGGPPAGAVRHRRLAIPPHAESGQKPEAAAAQAVARHPRPSARPTPELPGRLEKPQTLSHHPPPIPHACTCHRS